LRQIFYLDLAFFILLLPQASCKGQRINNDLDSHILKNVWNQAWIVNCQAVGESCHSIQYLAAYIFKVAISNSRMVKIENRRVFFKYKKSTGFFN